MYRNIVIPVEIGDAAVYASAKKVAAELLDDGGRVTLFHAIEPVPTYVETYLPPEIAMKSKEDAQEKLRTMAEELSAENTALVYGSAGRSIVDWADKNAADCVIVTSHKPEFSDLLLGSTAAWVVRHAQTNVLVLR